MKQTDLLFDVRCYRMSGIGRYIRGELSAMGFRLPGENPENPSPIGDAKRVGLLCHAEEARIFREAGYGQVIQWGAPPFSFKEQVASFLLLGKALQGTEAIWFPHWNVPMLFPKPRRVEMILTVHDLIPWTFPAYSRSIKSRLGWPIFLSAVRKADVIRCVSEATRKVLFEKIPESRNKKVEVLYPKVLPSFLEDPVFQRSVLERPWPAKWPFEKRCYALYVGNLKPHKGIDFLLDVWEEVQPKLPDSARLVLVGKSFGRQIPVRIAEIPGVIGLGEVPDEELWQLYAQAKVFCFPSFAEGFGTPPLEALAMGIPVITMKVPSLSELSAENKFISEEKMDWEKVIREKMA